ncbi:hypothetical protein VC83_09673 [Pseudogymnoascus destructans]|uniref:Uncharacterized protein n=1 Tax=Pseudogymnoascus destructans TaxID=655981 RepID=A0A2P6FGP0_9PEZI|nr:uncharacterized protein VC83_09673 [Pseudogymnoascus destructans]PQM43546.1 hypothetical protein VC83_09673 [Pseudogymnoascus destructans]
MVLPQSPSNRPITVHPKKGRISSLLIQTAEDDLDHPPKKQKLNYPAFPPAGFWDSLSRIPLTRNALRELNGRNAKDCCSSAHTRKLRRRGSNSHHQLAVPQRFARHGGPDLRDLRGYRIPTGPEDDMSSRPLSLGVGREVRSRQQSGARIHHPRAALPRIRQARRAQDHMIVHFSSI